jgi:uncharacterized protein YbjT (DUF2867 family)
MLKGGKLILVVGATGNVGTAVCRELSAVDERPRAFVRDAYRARHRLGDRIDLALGDLDQAETIDTALDGIDRVLLITATSARQLDHERNVIQAAKGAGVQYIVKLSVLSPEEQSPLLHARWHWQAEKLLEQAGVGFTTLRIAFLMQNLFFMVQGGAISTAAHDGRIGMVDARDVAAVAAAALTRQDHEGKTYILTGPQALSFDDVAKILSHAASSGIQHRRVSHDQVRDAIRALGADDWYAEDVAIFNGLIAAGYADVVTDDVRTITGSEPRTLTAFAEEFAGIFAGRTNAGLSTRAAEEAS